jgi:hypothetical protein
MISLREKFISIVDNDYLTPSDAIILLEGDGDSRCLHAIKLYKEGFSNKIIFSGGLTDLKYGSYPYEYILPILLKNGVKKEDIIHEDKSTNTLEQAIEIKKIIKSFGWKKIILIASPYHQYRAYLTFLKSIDYNNDRVVIYNSPAKGLSWFEENKWGRRLDLLELEFEKIKIYSNQGDLETFEEAIEYQKWKEVQ